MTKPRIVSDVPPSAERRMRISGAPGSLPAPWLDRLLSAFATIPIESGPEAVVTAVLDAISEILPEHAMGVCLVARGEQRLIVRRGPDGGSLVGPPDPARLFPKVANERVLVVDEAAGSTFHLAHDEAEAVAVEGIEGRFAERASLVLAGALRQAVSLEHVRDQSDELRKLQAQVIQSEKLASLGQIAAGVVHELNNPLTSIVAYSDFLRKKAERGGPGLWADADDLERLRRIGEAAERIRRFSRDLVDYARPSSGVLALVNVHDVIDQAMLFCEHLLGETSTQVTRRYTSEPSLVRGVSGELTQVFVNLITNACHAMRESGNVLTIDTAHSGERVRIEIGDNGHGIEDAHLQRIFEPFFTTKAEGRGTGLGLSIVRNIVLRHGGAVSVDSHEGRGAQFVVTLPLASPPVSPPTPPAAP